MHRYQRGDRDLLLGKRREQGRQRDFEAAAEIMQIDGPRIDGRGEALKTGCRSRPAQRLRLELAHGRAQRGSCLAAGGQRMFQRSEQSDRREARGGEVEDEAQKDAWWSPVERQAGRIIDLDAPAPQLTGDAAREVAVGGYQRRCFTRIF